MLNLRAVRSTLVWKPISKIWHKFHLFIFFNYFNKGFSTSFKRIKSLKPYKVEKPNLSTLKLTEDISKYLRKIDLLEELKRDMILSDDKNSYSQDIYNYLDISLKSKIFNFAIYDKHIQNFLNQYFGFTPRLNQIFMLYNIPKKKSIARGSRLWHRDTTDSDLRQIKVMIPISKINSQNGPFYFIKNLEFSRENIAILGVADEDNDVRVRDETIKKLSGNIYSTEGIANGSKVYFDSKRVYHKGGFAKSKDRLVLILVYNSNAFTVNKPQNFSSEIAFLNNTNTSYSYKKYLKNYLYELNRFTKLNRFEKLIRYLFFRLGIIFTFYIKT